LFFTEKEKKMQGSKLYVGNFSYSTTKEDLEKMFSGYGTFEKSK